MDEWIFLSGMMGSGKTTVARALGARLGVTPIDLDERIAARAGKSISALFAERGEAAFRALEAEETERLLASAPGGILALGGGTVTRAPTRRLLLSSRGVVVTLRATPDELARRTMGGGGRPLLANAETRQVVEELLAERADAYAECHGEVDTTGVSPDAVADAVLAVARRRPIPVALGRRTYRVEVGAGLYDARVPALLGEGDATAVIVTDANCRAPWATTIRAQVERSGRPVREVVLTPGEENKTLDAVQSIWDAALGAGVDRDGIVLAVGGGVVGDLAGFAAATLLRGIAVGQLPTSLLAMVDASVGGKTGFDRPEGKNLIGAFHQPSFVVCDVDALTTLPDVELSAGLAEVVKAAWLDSEAAVAALERDASALLARDATALERAIRMAVSLKARVVEADEREGGARRLLNLGHTIGHAIEAARGFREVRHGEAVALGMVAAFRVAAAVGDTEAAAHERRMVALLRAFSLPSEPEPFLDRDASRFLASDKKRAGGTLRFVVPGAPGHARVEVLALDAVRAAVGLAAT